MGTENRTSQPINLSKISHELRDALFNDIIPNEGMDIITELAEKIAEKANALAPVQDEAKSGPRRPEKWKSSGKPTDGPIKGNIVAIPSPNLPFTWLVMSPPWYSHFVEYGTSAYNPLPNPHRKIMIFRVEGMKWINTAIVNRPNIKPRPFLRPAADMAEQILQEIINKRGSIQD